MSQRTERDVVCLGDQRPAPIEHQARDGDLLAHTNHFLDGALSDCNLKVGESSATRVARITELLKDAPRPLDTAAFATMSRDHHDGVNNSLWRTGSQGATLSSWIIETPRSGAPKLRVLLANPGRPEQTNLFVLDDKFWKDTPSEHPAVKEKHAAKPKPPPSSTPSSPPF